MSNPWFTKSRDETSHFRMPDRIYDGKVVSNPALGINIYKKFIPSELCDRTIEVLERNLSGANPKYSWQPATVTESDDPMLDARYCVDFKIGQGNLGPSGPENSELYSIHEQCFSPIYNASSDYGRYWGVGIQYFEAFNFVKYDGVGTHFDIHADHGPAYVCTVSIVSYLNDDYEGGELYFPRFNLTIKPEKGDVVIFPSTFIYEHASKRMISGTKYSIVIMTDYNDRGGLRYHPYREYDNKLVY